MLGAAEARPLASFTLAGFPVEVRPFFLLVTAAAGLQSGSVEVAAVWVAVVTVSILLHELGHALAMRRFGFPARIELYAFGGLTHWPPHAQPTPRQELWVSAAGPAAGLLLGAAVWQLTRHTVPLPRLVGIAVRDLLWVNIGWSLVNLLPLLPLDGSGILDALLRLRRSTRRFTWTGWTSALTGGAVLLYAASGQNMWLAFLGFVGLMKGIERIKLGRAGRAPARGADGRDGLEGEAGALLPLARAGRLGERNLAELVRVLVREGRHAELVALVRERLATFDRRDDAEPLARLASQALADEALRAEALEVDQLAYRQLRLGRHAYDAAGHLTALRRHEEAVEWLGHALAAGLDCREAMRSDPELGPLHAREDFRVLLSGH